MLEPTLREVLRAHERILPFIRRTPIFSSRTVDRLTGLTVHFKTENFQKTGSFKARGALNGILTLLERKPTIKGVVTHSTGNHGLALAWAAQQIKLPCSVVVPCNTPAVKVEAVKAYGANVQLCQIDIQDRHTLCEKIADEKQFEIIAPFDNVDVIAGQGTIGIELMQQVPELEAVIVPVGGGGLAAGISLATKLVSPKTKVYMVEPLGKELGKSMKAGRRMWEGPPARVNTIADSIARQQLGEITWPIVLKYAENDVLSVTDQEIIEGMKFAFQTMKVVIESASATGLTALLQHKFQHLHTSAQNVGVILCGGNVDLDQLPWQTNLSSNKET
ncbi:probable serine racemase [Octopus bimaculoides]|uniref:Serine racemase n=1 Tax=Octopus bimaculoides TaxID=37653 RepID=A0A0L8GJA8_OCTBM|nr:probable serine racemase [Octopus bimaculoides]|eukprot:XP_014780876.1 PREDICTED: probable serine racemase [Octopus bimaculoides]